jgi:hypothetical protein
LTQLGNRRSPTKSEEEIDDWTRDTNKRGPTQIGKSGIYHTCLGTEETPLILDGKSEMDRKTELNSLEPVKL